MIENFQIKGLEKLANSGIIKDIYPMVDHIEIKYEDTGASGFGIDFDQIDVDIHLNDQDITKDNMYDAEFDPHYLIDYYLKKYFPYFNIDKVRIDFIVWNPDGDVIYSWKD
jgi:hypothetical protein